MLSLIETTGDDQYHGRKLRGLLKFIASDGRYDDNIIISLFPLLIFIINIIGNVHHVVVAIMGAMVLRFAWIRLPNIYTVYMPSIS
jgi:hypothetical protein